jgi:hypothetical protein
MSAPLEATREALPFWRGAPSAAATAGEASWPVGRLDVRFESQESLHRAVALLDGQTWLEDCHIDLGALTLHLRLAKGAGAEAPGFSLVTSGASTLH